MRNDEIRIRITYFLSAFVQIICRDPCTYREVNKWHGQQHREQDSQSNRHHHDVARHIHVVAKQQLRFHMIYEQETSIESGLGDVDTVSK